MAKNKTRYVLRGTSQESFEQPAGTGLCALDETEIQFLDLFNGNE